MMVACGVTVCLPRVLAARACARACVRTCACVHVACVACYSVRARAQVRECVSARVRVCVWTVLGGRCVCGCVGGWMDGCGWVGGECACVC